MAGYVRIDPFDPTEYAYWRKESGGTSFIRIHPITNLLSIFISNNSDHTSRLFESDLLPSWSPLLVAVGKNTIVNDPFQLLDKIKSIRGGDILDIRRDDSTLREVHGRLGNELQLVVLDPNCLLSNALPELWSVLVFNRSIANIDSNTFALIQQGNMLNPRQIDYHNSFVSINEVENVRDQVFSASILLHDICVLINSNDKNLVDEYCAQRNHHCGLVFSVLNSTGWNAQLRMLDQTQGRDSIC